MAFAGAARLQAQGIRMRRDTAPAARWVLTAVWLAGAAVSARGQTPLKVPDSQLEPVRWEELQGWTQDDHLAAFTAFQTSCHALRAMRPAPDNEPMHSSLREVCRRALEVHLQSAAAARGFFEDNFRPVHIARLGESQGFLTGYYEPVLQGSRLPSPQFHFPVYRRPSDLLLDGRKPGPHPIANKNAAIGRRDENNEIVPYYDRGAIEAGALDGQKLEICWLKDPFDVLIVQIEGSARVILEDGTPLRINYDSYNGYSYSSIGRVLIERKIIPREEMSMHRIRDWMTGHPDEAQAVRASNRSYVFFRVTGLSNDGEPIGGQGVRLTPGRSIAVDRLHEYGTPFFIEAKLPIENAGAGSPFHRLMIAQDTGSAIVGPARADLYWGAGDDAGRVAGRIRHPGKFVMLVPRDLDMVEAGRHMPLPLAKPKLAAAEAKKDGGKDKDKTQTAKTEERPTRRIRRQASPWRWYRL
jgi:membrane-bound lytic murein transglycosylase A